jgi:hypothetical protein
MLVDADGQLRWASADVAKDVTDGQRLPTNRRQLAKARAGQAEDGRAGT